MLHRTHSNSDAEQAMAMVHLTAKALLSVMGPHGTDSAGNKSVV